MYRILSIDAGGMHGYASLIFLKNLLRECPYLIEKVDLIAGTSIGGILGLGFALGHDIACIEENFIKGIPLAFTTNPVRYAAFIAGICTKYDTKKFKAFLRGVYGPKKLKDLEKNIIIPAFCLDNQCGRNRRWKAKIFHNFKGIDSDEEYNVVDVAMSTSAVPVIFPTYQKYVDGAVVANNPSFCAVAQTQDPRVEINPRPKLEEIVVLSIGSIKNTCIKETNLDWGYFLWSRWLLNMLTERDILMTDYLGNIFLGCRYHRVEFLLNCPMDDWAELGNIKRVGEQYPLEKAVDWIETYWR